MPEEYPKQIKSKTQETFKIDSFGLYAIEITALCEKNNDLKVEIDDIQFREIPPENNIQSYNIPSSWNGTNLKGLSKTIFFILTLNKGKHTLTFTPKNNAVIEGWGYNLLTNTNTINFENLPKVTEGDNRPLCSFILVNAPLKSVTADVSVLWHLFDGDDVKLIIDNKIEQNTKSRFWKNWVWHSSLRQVLTGVKRESKTFITNLDSNTHYIEFWTDRTPTLHKITLDLGDYNPKRIPTVEDPKWTGDFADDTDQMILARLIFGEARNQTKEAKVGVGVVVKNRLLAKKVYFGLNYHEIILKHDNTIYQFAALNPLGSNYVDLLDPISNADELTRQAWLDSYDIAQNIISANITDYIDGATFFHSSDLPQEVFLTEYMPGVIFIKQVDNMMFYKEPE